uniref:TDP-N-acetylfucosamine:lipid II N-acetylfucosaminyltransferase n=1 Tax=uncultured Altererythrobacter sp. TaxID=500840 RepID=UPI00263693E2|nr:TDP-N-acetylfucosamine:lipid II N-acetylfucosaminyltransferase [uncultured Altererythrobacter sp.]
MLDEKFNDMAIRQFEEAGPGLSEYWVVAREPYFTSSPLARTCSPKELVNRLSGTDVAGVVFHSLPPQHYRFLRATPAGKRIVWIGWGYDYYSLLGQDYNASLVLEKTSRIDFPTRRQVAKNDVKAILNKLGLWGRERKVSNLSRIDYFSPVLDIEYDLIRQHVPIRAAYLHWNYATAEEDLAPSGSVLENGKNILAGNSSSATNNHVELFEAIRDQVDLSSRKVVTPLSYGDARYRERVIEIGQRILGDNFHPLADFMPKEEYLETIRSCGFVIMNHLRQQAVGNICSAMLMGAKVYLNPRNPLMGWFQKRGAIVGSIASLDMTPLTKQEELINRELVYEHWGRERQRRKTKNLIDTILGTT